MSDMYARARARVYVYVYVRACVYLCACVEKSDVLLSVFYRN